MPVLISEAAVIKGAAINISNRAAIIKGAALTTANKHEILTNIISKADVAKEAFNWSTILRAMKISHTSSEEQP